MGNEDKKNRLLIVMIALLALLILVLGGGIGYLALKKEETVTPVANVPEKVDTTSTTTKTADVAQKEMNSLAVVDPEYADQPPLFYQIKPDFLINLANEKQGRYLQVQVQISSRNPTMIAAFETYSPLIKHELIELFTRKNFNELSSDQGKEHLRKEALLVIRKIMKKETGKVGVEDVLFTSFLMQ